MRAPDIRYVIKSCGPGGVGRLKMGEYNTANILTI